MDAAMTLQERKPEICITHDFGKEFQSDWHHSSAYKKALPFLFIRQGLN
ncbi:hypothetical protein [Phocaeicola sp.]